VRRVSSQAMTLAAASVSLALGERSSRLPMGVATRAMTPMVFSPAAACGSDMSALVSAFAGNALELSHIAHFDAPLGKVALRGFQHPFRLQSRPPDPPGFHADQC